jgi:hypothetical protein
VLLDLRSRSLFCVAVVLAVRCAWSSGGSLVDGSSEVRAVDQPLVWGGVCVCVCVCVCDDKPFYPDGLVCSDAVLGCDDAAAAAAGACCICCFYC